MAEAESHAVATERDLLISQLEDEVYRLTALLNASALVAGSLEVDTVLDELVRQAAQVLRAEGASLLLLDPEANELVFRVAHGEKGKQLVGQRFPCTEGIAGAVATTCEPVLIRNARQDPRHYPRFDEELKFTTGSMLAVPVQVRGEVLGVLEVLNPATEADFTEDDLSLLIAFAGQAGLALSNARAHTGIARQLALVVNSMQDGFILLGWTGDVELINPAARRMLGLRADVPVTRADLAGAAGSPDALAPVDADTEYDIGIEAPGHLPRQVHVTATVLVGPAGGQAGTILVLHDVSRMRELDRLKNEVIATVSHELRTPVASIQGSAQLLADGTIPAGSDEGGRFLDIIQRNAHRLAKLVTNIVDLSQLGTGRLEVSPNECSMRDIIMESAQREQIHFDEASQELTVDVPADLPAAWADALRVGQVLEHLLDNASKFSPEGGRITLAAAADDDAVTVRVLDSGPGLDADRQERAFAIFEQLSDPNRDRSEGAGIGLPIARGIIDALGGRMWIEPRAAGTGTEIAFSLPRRPPAH